ncbi:LuxR family transcriptional regulator [Pantoea sp.]|uniref:helix-turn-helix transcriptional regulator n=2 Tax=Pantoea sp. TaxID=69393 RepID=UPI00290062D7|nr:LuxR family transcriptional regulator [Pantoea sp.]MDU2731101.1 LuxR family transcriptional regulator [Pantoea sp.]
MFSYLADNPSTLQTLQDYIERRMVSPEVQEYAYLVISKINPYKTLLVSNYPDEWIKIYQDNHFQFIDPVVLKAFKQSSPFAWDENITFLTDRIFTLSRRYNILNGFTFVLHDHHNNLALLSVISQSDDAYTAESPLWRERQLMQMRLIEFNAQMYRLIDMAAVGMQVICPDATKAIFTQREQEVLYWASMGKTYPEIATILVISVSTVKFHMGNIVNKLQVANARQAIRRCAAMNLISSPAMAES